MFIILHKGQEIESITRKEIKIPHNHNTQKEAQLLWGCKPSRQRYRRFSLTSIRLYCYMPSCNWLFYSPAPCELLLSFQVNA